MDLKANQEDKSMDSNIHVTLVQHTAIIICLLPIIILSISLLIILFASANQSELSDDEISGLLNAAIYFCFIKILYYYVFRKI